MRRTRAPATRRQTASLRRPRRVAGLRQPRRDRVIERQIRHRVGLRVVRPALVSGVPSPEVREQRPSLGMQPRQRRLLDPPAPEQLFDHQLGIEHEFDLGGPQRLRPLQREHDGRPLGEVVGLDAERPRDGRDRRCHRVGRAGQIGIDEDGSGRGRPGVAARGAVSPDEQAPCHGHSAPTPRAGSGPSAASATSGASAGSDLPPRMRRHAIRNGS